MSDKKTVLSKKDFLIKRLGGKTELSPRILDGIYLAMDEWHNHCKSREVERALRDSKRLAKMISDYPAKDLQDWIDYGKPVTITVPTKVFELALSITKE